MMVFYTLIKKVRQSFLILKYTSYRFYRARQIEGKIIKYKINGIEVEISGKSIWSMIEEIIISDSYHLRRMSEPQVIIDVGANVGIFSLHAATLFPNCKIYSFEPSLDNFKLLVKNTSGFSNIKCLQWALGSYDGAAFIQDNNDNTAYEVSYQKSAASKLCDIIKLETFVLQNDIDKIDVLKLDCEGGEYEVLKSDLKIIKEIVGEFHVIGSKNSEKIKSVLQEKGFFIRHWKEFPSKQAGLFWASNSSVNIYSLTSAINTVH